MSFPNVMFNTSEKCFLDATSGEGFSRRLHGTSRCKVVPTSLVRRHISVGRKEFATMWMCVERALADAFYGSMPTYDSVGKTLIPYSAISLPDMRSRYQLALFLWTIPKERRQSNWVASIKVEANLSRSLDFILRRLPLGAPMCGLIQSLRKIKKLWIFLLKDEGNPILALLYIKHQISLSCNFILYQQELSSTSIRIY